MVGGKDSASGWEEIGTSSSCLEASVSDNSTASAAAFFPGLEMPATWGARGHPKTKRGQDMSQEMGGAKADRFADGQHGVHFLRGPSFFLPGSHGRG